MKKLDYFLFTMIIKVIALSSTALAVELKHMSDPKSCLLCHTNKDSKNADDLILLDGTRVREKESPQLCGQCHGPIYTDWQRRIHGKLIGKGTPEERQLSCTQCHDPHNPRFPQMRAEHAPKKPKFLKEKKEGHHGN